MRTTPLKLNYEVGEPKFHINPTSKYNIFHVGLKSHTMQMGSNLKHIYFVNLEMLNFMFLIENCLHLCIFVNGYIFASYGMDFIWELPCLLVLSSSKAVFHA